jgi:type VI secretion system protein ImpA
MASLEETILVPITPDDPCGPNLEYDSAFAAFERASQGKPEQQLGDTIVAAEEPDWKAVHKQATELLGRSKDLRIAFKLTMALLKTRGLAGFAEGLAVVRGMVETFWEGFHPRLDPDDDNDPTMRVNIIAGLLEPEVLNAVRAAPLVSSRAVGRFALKDVEVANGEAPPPTEGQAPTVATLEAALLDCDLEELAGTTSKAHGCVEALTAIEAYVTDQVGAASAPNLSKLVGLVRRAQGFLSGGLARRQGVADGGGAAGAVAGGGGNGAGLARGGGGALTGEIGSREDVLRALDKICGYYARYEPSSPIPMFMERCKRLVTMSFIDIVKDLVPEAVNQVETLKGRTPE